MADVKYVKMWKGESFELVEEDRVERFLAVGFKLEEPKAEKKSPAKGRKNKITADAQVTSIKKEEEEEWWDPNSGEDWADSIESVSAPEGERLSDLDSDNAKEEN